MANSLLPCPSGQSRRWILNRLLAMALALLTLPLHAQMTTFNATGTNQFYTVPANGTLTITARGGNGGNGESLTGGSAATVSATFAVQQGDMLTIVAGQKGVSVSRGDGGGGGGGGGSAVIATRSGARTLLLVAGAGGGGQRTFGGGGGTGFGGSGGGGGGGQGMFSGGGGGGFGAGGGAGTGGFGAGNGSAGGGGGGDENGGGSGGTGFGGGSGGFGFGGGGGGSFDGGGGGGYMGGDGGASSGGGGGSSFVQAAGVFAATSPSVNPGTNGGGTNMDGSVVLNLVVDNSCGPNGQNVKMCYYGLDLCVPKSYVARYKSIGATEGGCASGRTRLSYEPQSSGIALQLALKAFPNPVQDVLTLEVLAPKAGVATFEVLDMTGRARQTRRENLVEGLNEIEFRLGSLPTGLYLIRAVDALGQQGVVKISKE